MTTLPEIRHSVWLHQRRIGTLRQRGDHTWFQLDEEYVHDPARDVLGLVFEQNLGRRHARALRLPEWFSNLLPEGTLRGWIADDRGVSADREMELLAQVGHDLPGAVRVLADDETPSDGSEQAPDGSPPPDLDSDHPGWRFSLAGVALKFSMLAKDDRLTLPAYGEGGDWIVKLPDSEHPDVPRNEHAMMSLARAAGLDVPPTRLVHRDQLDGLPSLVWARGEEWAYAVKRFDRDGERGLVHIEDLAQVRGCYPGEKYTGNYETVANLIYRGRDIDSLREFARRLAFTILISNGDAHLKNWSLIYPNRRIPALSPAYDLVSTGLYHPHDDETLGSKFTGTKRFSAISLHAFDRLESRLNAGGAGLADQAAALVNAVREHWPETAESLTECPRLREGIGRSIDTRSESLLNTSP